jgi:predicted outer membrane repeat protein
VKLNVQGNTFEENYSGGKGSALYVKGFSSIRLVANTFVNNGPVYAMTEVFYSPYFTYFS